ncbi:MAG: sigma-70 family RNA polymerase sigma factor [Collimonas sp.]
MNPSKDDSHWASLMAAAQHGDQRSYVRLLREITPLLRRLTQQQRPTDRSDELEVIVQETLLTIHAQRHTYDRNRPFQPWLLTLLQLLIADAAKRHTRTTRREISVDSLDVTSALEQADSVYEEIVDESPLDSQTMRRSIAELPHGKLYAIEPVKQNENLLNEASAATGMSIAAFKATMHRVLETLRALLAAPK